MAFPPAAKQSTATASLLALGIVYGDIGTSPLYAVKETFNPEHGIPLTTPNILGGLSTIFWILMVVVSLKYVTLVLRADTRGEGGIMALLALATASVKQHPQWTRPLLLLGVFGASLFYGDAVLTPAMSVLSAVEGLEVGTAVFKPYIVPLATGILIALFLIQKHGTGFVGLLFGPVCALWFASIGAVGVWNIAGTPAIIASQATISGAFSMTRQAIQLGYLPRMDIEHTSAKVISQIYIPAVNWTLLVVVALAVIGFGSSTRLGSAYGVAVMGTMLVTS